MITYVVYVQHKHVMKTNGQNCQTFAITKAIITKGMCDLFTKVGQEIKGFKLRSNISHKKF